MWCASRKIIKGQKRQKGQKGKISLSKRQRLLTITNYSLLITNYFGPFGLLGPVGPFSVAVAWNKRNQQEHTGQQDLISCQKGLDLFYRKSKRSEDST